MQTMSFFWTLDLANDSNQGAWESGVSLRTCIRDVWGIGIHKLKLRYDRICCLFLLPCSWLPTMSTSNIQTKTNDGNFLLLSVLLLFLLSYSSSFGRSTLINHINKEPDPSIPFFSPLFIPWITCVASTQTTFAVVYFFLTDAIEIISRVWHDQLDPCPCPRSLHYLTRLYHAHDKQWQGKVKHGHANDSNNCTQWRQASLFGGNAVIVPLFFQARCLCLRLSFNALVGLVIAS